MAFVTRALAETLKLFVIKQYTVKVDKNETAFETRGGTLECVYTCKYKKDLLKRIKDKDSSFKNKKSPFTYYFV